MAEEQSFLILEVPRKDDLPGCGIYAIYCTESDKWYIGQTGNFGKRANEHRRDLSSGKHCNEHIQRAFNLYGPQAFTFLILARCGKDELNYWEQYFVDKYNAADENFGYNIQYFDENGKPTYRASFADNVRKGRKIKRLGPNDAKVVRELYCMGYTMDFIIKKYRVSVPHQIYRILSNRTWYDPNYTKPKKTPSLNPEETKIVEVLVRQGKSINQIIAETNISYNRLNKFLRKSSGRRGTPKHHCLILNLETGIYYFSYKEAAISIGIPPHRMWDWLFKFPERNETSLTLLDGASQRQLVRVTILDTYSGVYYDSYKEAATAIGVSPRTMTKWLTTHKHHNQSNLIICE